MSNYDVRSGEDSNISQIHFSDSGELGADYIYLDEEGDIAFNASYIRKLDLSNAIKALQKAKEQGWGT